MLVLVKGDRRTGSQVSPTTQILVLVQGGRQMGSQVNERKKRVKSLHEWILNKLRRQEDKFFFTKLTMQNIEEFCSVSIVKRGHLLLPNF